MYFHHHGVAPFHFLFVLVVFLLVVGGAVWLFVSLTRGRFERRPAYRPGNAPTALETLDLRYARGELSRDEYLQARDDLGGRAAPI